MSNISKNQLDELKGLMEADLARLVEETQDEMNPASRTNFNDIDGDVADDEATADVLVDTDNAMIGLHLKKINDLNDALDRVKTGAYGRCIDCDDDISYERLTAYPAAKRCIKCQSLHEKTYAS